MINLQHTTDKRVIEGILFDKELWARISEDGQLTKDFNVTTEPPLFWYLLMKGSLAIGLALFVQKFERTIDVHINVLKSYRDSCASLAGEAIKQKFFESKFIKMETLIPVKYLDVYNFAKKMGMVDEGLSKNSIMKNGVMMNQFILGMINPRGL